MHVSHFRKMTLPVIWVIICLTACASPFTGENNSSDNRTDIEASGQEPEESGERIDIEFTVCEEGRLPDELVDIIESKKAQPFRLAFTTREYMYIVVGYGAQQRGGCAVTVNQLYRTETAVHIDTNLIGVEGETIKIDGMTYPYVAVRCENQNLPVIYE